MDIEKIAVNSVSLAISASGYLVPNIHSGDKEPSWDGDVEVYKKAGSVHSKADLMLRVPVQVKGKVSTNLKKSMINFPIEISDMRNYLQDGGIVYFVVLIDSSGERTQIYYVTLLPFELKKILAKHGAQRARSITLKVFPSKNEDMTNVFLNVARNMKKQMHAILNESVTLDELKKAGQLKELTFGYASVPNENRTPFDYFFEQGTYLYAKSQFGIELPIEYYDRLEMAETTLSGYITVQGKCFYDKYRIIYKKETLELCFGKSSKLTINRNGKKTQQFTFTLNGTLTERIRDLDFIISSVSAKQFEIKGNAFKLTRSTLEEFASFNLSREKKQLEWLKTVKLVFDKIDVTDDLDCSKLTARDEHIIQLLKVAILDGKAVSLNASDSQFGYFKIANLKILIYFKKQDQNNGLFRIYNYNDAPVEVRASDPDGKEYPSCFIVLLKKEDFLQCSNINYRKMFKNIQAVSFSEVYSSQLVMLLLNMLSAYDESKSSRKDILDAALKLATWLRENDPYAAKDILTLNYYQVIKRMRKLDKDEIKELIEIIENQPDNEEVYIGAYLLLGDQTAAEIHFHQMDKKTQTVFRDYPIFRFWNED